MKFTEFVPWFLSKIVGLLLFLVCFYIGFQFPGAFLWLYLTDGSFDGWWNTTLFLVGVGVSNLFWYGVYRTAVGFRLMESFLRFVMNLLEHGYYKGDGLQ